MSASPLSVTSVFSRSSRVMPAGDDPDPLPLDFRVRQFEHAKSRQSLQLTNSFVSNGHPAEIQPRQVSPERPEMMHSAIGDLTSPQAEVCEIDQLANRLQALIGYLAIVHGKVR